MVKQVTKIVPHITSTQYYSCSVCGGNGYLKEKDWLAITKERKRVRDMKYQRKKRAKQKAI